MFEPHELVGRSFLMPHNPDGTRERATVIGYEQEESPGIDVMENFQKELDQQSARVKFKARVGAEGLERYVEWSDMCEFVEEQIQHEDQTWNFRKIIGHRRDLGPRDKPQIQIEWESGEITFEPITEFYKDEPWLLAEYAQEKGLIDDWERRCPRLKLHRHAKNAQKMMRVINQAKRQSYQNTPIYMFGVKVPRNHEQAVKFDEKNGEIST